MAEERPESVEHLNYQQLEIYAKELQQLFHKERDLREQLEQKNAQLEQRVREVNALNNMLQQHLAQRFSTAEVYRDILGNMRGILEQLQGLVERAESQPLPDLQAPEEFSADDRGDVET